MKSKPDSKTPILVWDLPVRVFHWLMVGCFAVAWVSAESERWRLLHVTMGYTMAALVAFRIIWGLIGTRHARFAGFVRGPRAVARYVASMLRGRPEASVGHNPAGAWAIVALLVLTGVTGATGWAADAWANHWLEEAHEVAAHALLTLVIVHVAGVAVGSWLHRENLVRSMFTGRKAGAPTQAIGRSWRPVGLLVLAAVLGFWWLQWTQAPVATTPHAASKSADDD